jgi:LAO/AO transport system kinase
VIVVRATRRRSKPSLDDYVNGVLSGDRTVLSRAITLIESRNPAHRELAQELLLQLLPHSGNAHRVGITGIPGVGKSTLIDALGTNLTQAGHRVAVMAVDPSSSRTGGSILGDKTRMERLSRDANAYIRPSPSAGSLGGVARSTREAIILCEAAGFDVVLVETIGVGQSEIAVAGMVDFFLVLVIAGAGDELQGIKRGVLELADMVAVNKADGQNKKRAAQAASELVAALNIMQPVSANWRTPVITCSGMRNQGLEDIWERVGAHRRKLSETSELELKRRRQRIDWMWATVEDRLLGDMRDNPSVAHVVTTLEHDVAEGRVTPGIAAQRILAAFNSNS